MPYNSETESFYRRQATVLDVTPYGDTVKQGVAEKQNVTLDDLYDDLNTLKTVGGSGLPDGGLLVAENGTWKLRRGLIFMWSGTAADIPTNAALCDGTNGTPDLRDRFIIGAGKTYAAGSSGGSAEAKLTTSASQTGTSTQVFTPSTLNLPYHTHLGWAGWSQGSEGAARVETNRAQWMDVNQYAGGGQGHSHTLSDPGHSHTVVASLPPYYALCFIMTL